MNQLANFTRHDRDKASVLHPYSNLKKHLEVGPTIITHGEGAYVFDDAGNRFLDSGAGLWCNSLGYASERVAHVASEALRKLSFFQIFGSASHASAIDLSEKLLEIAPTPMSKVMLQCSGSEANDTAVKIAWYYWNGLGQPQRRKIISRQRSYHGSTCVAISLTGNPAFHKSFGLPFEGFIHVESPNFYRGAVQGENEEAFSQRLADSLEQRILQEGPDTVAAFFADPVQANAGAVPPPVGYFEKVQAVLRKYGILFVADEVICGFARTGNLWGSETYQLQPDLLTSAKALSAAMLPISAVLINDRVFEVIKEQSDRNGSFFHGYTYAGHPVSTAVSLEVIRIYEEMNIVQRVKSLESAFLQGLRDLTDHPMVGNASGVGLLGGIDIVKKKDSRENFGAAAELARHLDNNAKKHGLILRFVPDRIALSPTLIITDEEIADMFKRLRMTLDDTYAEVRDL